MYKKIGIIVTIALIAILQLSTAYATPPSNPHIESGTAAEGGNFFEYKADDGTWKDLKTPPHWVSETGEVAYCLEHMIEGADGELYSKFNPEAVYSEETYNGLKAILMHSYPYRNAGLTDQQIRYATANAIRSWLKESAGIGYDFMLQSSNRIRVKNTAGQGAYNFYLQLMDKARAGTSVFIPYAVNTSPSTVKLTEDNGILKGSATISLNYLNGGYSIDSSKLPSGVSITGFTGGNGNVLTITAPISMQGQDITVEDIFIGKDNRGSVNFYWLDTTSRKQAVVVPVVDSWNPVVCGDLSLTSDPPPQGYIEINKTDAVSGERLSGAEFKIIDSDGIESDRITTDANGVAKSSLLPIGTYSVVEVTAPGGYLIDSTNYENIEVTDANTTKLNITNKQPNGIIRITKINGNPEMGNYSLEGVKFTISDKSGNVFETITIDTEGLANSSELPLGTYMVQEIIAPYGYVLDDTEYSVILEYEDQNTAIVYADLTISNMPQTGTITIFKRDSETYDSPQGDARFTGTVFGIYNTRGDLIEELDCGDNDSAASNPLPLGEYTIKEIEAPEGYLINDIPYTVQLEYSNQSIEVNNNTYSITDNVIKGRIEINKTADVPLAEWNTKESNPPMSDVEFEITLKSTGEVVEVLTTDSNGKALSKLLPYGTYVVTEIKTPEGYILYEPFEVYICEDGKTYGYDIENQVYKSQVKIEKVDADTGETITMAGTEFQIRDANGDLIVQNTNARGSTDTFITDETGIIISEPLIYGEYTLHEIKAPYGYWLDEEPIPFSIGDSGLETITVESADELIEKRIRIIKTDSRDGERRLEDAVFEVYKGSELIDTITTNENGYAETKLLTVGEYTIIETKAPEGFILENISFDVTVSDDDTMIYEYVIENCPTEVVIIKTDINDGTLLSGAHIEIYSEAEELVYEGDTDEKGEFVVYELPIGKYTFKESVAPLGYILNDEVYEFEILGNGEIIGITEIQNKHTEVTLSKTDLIDGAPVEDAEIEIIDSDGESVYKGKTDENGEIYITHLTIGTYTFGETKAPDGYVKSVEEIEFTIDEYGNVSGETEISNCPTVLEIYKVKYEDNEPLTGAGFKVKNYLGLNILSFVQNEDGSYTLDKDGDITEIAVDENGKAVIYGLHTGSYWLEECTVPSGYYPTAPIKVTISENNDIEVPCKTVIPNSIFVKLGLDRERWIIPIVLGVLVTASGLFFFIRRKRRLII